MISLTSIMGMHIHPCTSFMYHILWMPLAHVEYPLLLCFYPRIGEGLKNWENRDISIFVTQFMHKAPMCRE
jgi:hypothetical protein